MKKRKRKKSITLLILAFLCIIAFFALFISIKQLNKSMYPLKYSQYVDKYSLEYDIDPLVVYSIIHTESGFKPEAKSAANAIGLMQITEETFAWIKSKIARDETLVFDDLYNPDTAIRFGSYYISVCLNRYENDLSTAAAAYHSGWGTVDKLLDNEEYTQDGNVLSSFPYKQMNLYVYKINKSYDSYKKIYQEEVI